MDVINNPEAIRFVNEVVRPMCEKLRALKAEIDSARASYDARIGTYFAGHGLEPIADNRESEGVSRLIGNDVLAFNAFALYTLKAAFEAPGVAELISRPCVRPLRAE